MINRIARTANIDGNEMNIQASATICGYIEWKTGGFKLIICLLNIEAMTMFIHIVSDHYFIYNSSPKNLIWNFLSIKWNKNGFEFNEENIQHWLIIIDSRR